MKSRWVWAAATAAAIAFAGGVASVLLTGDRPGADAPGEWARGDRAIVVSAGGGEYGPLGVYLHDPPGRGIWQVKTGSVVVVLDPRANSDAVLVHVPAEAIVEHSGIDAIPEAGVDATITRAELVRP